MLAEAVALVCGVNVLCYRSRIVWAAGVPFSVWYIRRRIGQKAQKRRQRLYFQFQDMLHGLQTSVRAGDSMETAVGECRKQMELIYGKKNDLVSELSYMEGQLKVGVPLEQLFADFGGRSGVEDIRCFGEVFGIARRAGGNLGEMMERMADILGRKIETDRQVEVSIAAKQLEQTVMSIVPGAMILYMQFTSPGFLDVLYGNAAGVCIMTGCLGIYLLSFVWGRRIVKIKV